MKAKLTVELSGRALETLDRLMKDSGFGSRGRTIEEAILAIDDLSTLAEKALKLVPSTSNPNPSNLDTTKAFMALTSFLTFYIAAISRFRAREG